MYTLYIVSPSGTLKYHSNTESINKSIIFSSTIHSLVNMSINIFTDIKIKYINLENKIISIFKTLKNILIIIIGNRKVKLYVFKMIYRKYIDFIMNPFVDDESVVRNGVFEPMSILKECGYE